MRVLGHFRWLLHSSLYEWPAPVIDQDFELDLLTSLIQFL